jgi:hypothetical protein
VLDATTSVEVRGVLAAPGGRGGESDVSSYAYDIGGAGGGGGGRIKIYGPVVGDIHPPSVAGGTGGSIDYDTPGSCPVGEDGGPGTIYVDDLVAGPPSLTVAGTCGSVSATVTGGTPFGWVQWITGELAGADVVPDPGICAGVTTGLAAPERVGTRVLDETGSGTWRVPAGVPCGALFQVVDLWSCTTSPVVTLP